MPMECDDDGTWSYRPRPKPAAAPVAPEPPVSTTLDAPLLDAAAEPTDGKDSVVQEAAEEEEDQRGLLISFLALCLSIPALIGAWCWPALVMGLVSGTVSAAARGLGHVISFWITLVLMVLVMAVLAREAFWGPRQYAPFKTRFGPMILMLFAAILIMADPTRSVWVDDLTWAWCGNNPDYDRINSTSGWNDHCNWSGCKYRCTIPCCVSTWQPVSNSTDHVAYSWLPPTADFSPAGLVPGDFLTLRPDDTIYMPDDAGAGPFPTYYASLDAPLSFYETGAVNPLKGGKTDADCKYGANPLTGYCFLTDQRLTYEEQLAQLGQYDGATLRDPDLPFNATSNNYVCGCDGCTPHEDWGHLSIVGAITSIVCTYLGFVLLAIAVGWNANILTKFKKVGAKWNKLRAAQKRQAAKAAAQADVTPYTVSP